MTEQSENHSQSTSSGLMPWVLTGLGLYTLDQATKFWIVNEFPVNYVNEHRHIYAYVPSFKHVKTDAGSLKLYSTESGFAEAKGYQVDTVSHAITGENGHEEFQFIFQGKLTDEVIEKNQAELTPQLIQTMQKLKDLEPMNYLDGTLNITRVHNTGVAFGFGNGSEWSSYVFLMVPIVALVVLMRMCQKGVFYTKWLKFALVLFVTGILGNLTDRLVQGFLLPYESTHSFFTKLMNGYVVDFIDVTIPFIDYRWPAFNVADSCIFVAAFIFFFSSIAESRKVSVGQKTEGESASES